MQTLLDTILKLPPTDRLQLLEQIWDSLDPPVPFPLREPQPPRQGWSEQFANARDDNPDREWLDAPLTDWDDTEWEW